MERGQLPLVSIQIERLAFPAKYRHGLFRIQELFFIHCIFLTAVSWCVLLCRVVCLIREWIFLNVDLVPLCCGPGYQSLKIGIHSQKVTDRVPKVAPRKELPQLFSSHRCNVSILRRTTWNGRVSHHQISILLATIRSQPCLKLSSKKVACTNIQGIESRAFATAFMGKKFHLRQHAAPLFMVH